MKALKIVEVKSFMAKLLIQDMFDQFLMSDFTMNTFARFQVAGKINLEYFNSEEKEELEGRMYVKWKEIKPFAYSVVKGNKTPLSFHISLMLSQEGVGKVIEHAGIRINPEEVSGLYIHIKFENSTLYIITGLGLKTFTMDKTLENVWDDQVKAFLKKNEIAFMEE